jgi:non-heme Fe2+,alpha-ketoglutarate-dependent halogenase
VRGVDRYGNFELEQRPDADMSEAAQAYHAAVVGGHSKILMRDTERQMRA